jgi:hypothetical protein
MKLVREHINEFERGNNSLKNLGIGTRRLISTFMKENNKDDTDDNALCVCSKRGKTEWVEYLLNNGADVHAYNDYSLQMASENGYTDIVKLLLDAGADVRARNHYALRWASNRGHTELVKVLQDWIAKESLNEFERGNDSLKNLGIGKKALIENWLNEYNINEYVINDDFTIDVLPLKFNHIGRSECNVTLANRNLTQLPEFIQFNDVYGFFNISSNPLTTLRGCPKRVLHSPETDYSGNFRCDNCQLKTLEYIPTLVMGNVNCQNNPGRFAEEDVIHFCNVQKDIYV